MINIKTWIERANERGIGSCEARDEELVELRNKLNETIEQLELAQVKTYADQISDVAKERDAALSDAQKWRAYQSRKDAVIAAGMGKKALRETVAEHESTKTVDGAWSQFCGGIGRGPDAPYPGMIEAFEAHYGQSFTDKDWRNETGVWAAAWGYATRQSAASCQVKFHTKEAQYESPTATR